MKEIVEEKEDRKRGRQEWKKEKAKITESTIEGKINQIIITKMMCNITGHCSKKKKGKENEWQLHKGCSP